MKRWEKTSRNSCTPLWNLAKVWLTAALFITACPAIIFFCFYHVMSLCCNICFVGRTVFNVLMEWWYREPRMMVILASANGDSFKRNKYPWELGVFYRLHTFMVTPLCFSCCPLATTVCASGIFRDIPMLLCVDRITVVLGRRLGFLSDARSANTQLTIWFQMMWDSRWNQTEMIRGFVDACYLLWLSDLWAGSGRTVCMGAPSFSLPSSKTTCSSELLTQDTSLHWRTAE